MSTKNKFTSIFLFTICFYSFTAIGQEYYRPKVKIDSVLTDSLVCYELVPETNSFRLQNKFEYIYDPSGNIISESYWSWYKGELSDIGTTRELYSYNSKGKVIKKTDQKLQTSGWASIKETNFIYDAKGNLTEELEEYEKIVYKYDLKGNKISQLESTFEDDKWRRVQLTTYTYDAANNLIKEVEDGASDLQHLYTYDSQRKLIKECYQEWNGKDWTGYDANSYQDYYYDEKGNLIKTVYFKWEKDKWVKSSSTDSLHYTYDTKGNLIHKQYQTRKDNSITNPLVNKWQWIFTYHDNGNRSGEKLQDWKNGQWVTRIQVTYDFAGYRTSDLEHEWKNDQLVIKSQHKYSNYYHPKAK